MKKTFLVFLVSISWISTQASHILGGTVDYTINSVEGNTVDMDVTFSVYRDGNSNGAEFDPSINIAIYSKSGSSYNLLRINNTSLGNVTAIDFGDVIDCPSWLLEGESAEYTTNFVFNIASTASDFIVAYQRCCRGYLENVMNPEETGIALTVYITRAGMSKVGHVSGFDDAFPIVHKSGSKTYDMSIDDDLEKLYYLSKAQVAGGVDGFMGGDPNSCTGITPDPINCPPPFETATFNPDFGEFGLRDQVSMDSETGELSVDLTNLGVYLYAVEGRTYENGELLNIVYQQFTQHVAICNSTNVTNTEENNHEIYPVPATDKIYFDIPLIDVTVYDTRGSIVLKSVEISYEKGISIHKLLSGIYIMTGMAENGNRITKRFIKG